MIAPIRKPLAWLSCWVVAVSWTGSLTVVARASCCESEYVGLCSAPLVRPLLSCCAPSLTWLELELRVSLPEASEPAAWLVSVVPPTSCPVEESTVAAPEATSDAPVARAPALVLRPRVAPSRARAPPASARSAAARARAPSASTLAPRATPRVPLATTRAPTATALARAWATRSEAQNSAEPPAWRHRSLSWATSPASVPVAVESRSAPFATVAAPREAVRMRSA